MAGAYGFKDAENACGIDVGGELGGVETYLDVGLGGEIVNLVGPDFTYNLYQGHRVAHVGVVEVEAGFAFEVGYALAEVHRGAADDAVNDVTFFK